ncbi:MAG: hypothetical protein IT449_07540 [Phycisphaerales bacterium]|nr:hypothetical protein [Phycisphaerales bacterium]
MANLHKAQLLQTLRERFGELRRLSGSQSLFVVGEDAAIIYFRYSKVHERGRTFFGLRDVDLKQLEGRNSFLCLLVDDGSPPIFVPFADFEEVFHSAEPASDGQYKVQLISQEDSRQLYIARKGRFNVEGYVGMGALELSIDSDRLRAPCALTHSQVQTLLGGVGRLKGYEVWIPDHDVATLDWTMTPRYNVAHRIPPGFDDVASILCEVDVVWSSASTSRIEGLFEVEHSTPIYSGLLRFNDLLLTNPALSRFHIVSNDVRRAVFSRQASRPTFRRSGLSELVSFLEYVNVLDWHSRLLKGVTDGHAA